MRPKEKEGWIETKREREQEKMEDNIVNWNNHKSNIDRYPGGENLLDISCVKLQEVSQVGLVKE